MYRTPNGDLYPSVTTVLSVLPKPELEAWKASVGEEEARKVSERALRYGSLAHTRMELYVNGEDPDGWVFDTPREALTFDAFRTAIDGHLTNVVAQEIFLYSDILQMAGAADLLGDWDNEEAIIDYKTSGRQVFPEEIEHYFIQLAAYSAMVYERYGMQRKLLVIVMAVNDDEEPLVMTRRVDPELGGKLLSVRAQYKEKYGI